MNTEVMFSSDKNYWETPQKLFDELDAEFHFTLDAAASDENHKCTRYFTQKEDGLRQNWGGETVFCNPPYGSKETGLWTEKCCREGQKPGVGVRVGAGKNAVGHYGTRDKEELRWRSMLIGRRC